jgi:hypothetical protein
MADPADFDQLHHAVSLQGSTIRRHEELLQGLLERLSFLMERHNHGIKAIMEHIRELAQRLPVTSEKPQSPSNFFHICGEFVHPIPGPPKIAYIFTLMSGRALSWASAVWEQQSAICSHLEEFMAEVSKVFESPVSGRKVASKLLDLRQNPRSVADYAVDFRTLAI